MVSAAVFHNKTLKWIFDHRRSRAYIEFIRLWTLDLRKRLNAVVKANCKRWFGAAYTRRNFSFNVAYNRERCRLYVWGVPPNSNVDKSMSRKERPPRIPKRSREKVFLPYSRIVRTGGIWHRKEQPEHGERGLWYTSAYRRPRAGQRFYAKKVLADHTAEGKGEPRKGFNYPAAFSFDAHGKVFFLRHDVSLSDMVMSGHAASPFTKAAREAFDAIIAKYNITPIDADEIFSSMTAAHRR